MRDVMPQMVAVVPCERSGMASQTEVQLGTESRDSGHGADEPGWLQCAYRMQGSHHRGPCGEAVIDDEGDTAARVRGCPIRCVTLPSLLEHIELIAFFFIDVAIIGTGG